MSDTTVGPSDEPSGSASQPLILVYYWGALMPGANGSQVRTIGQLEYLSKRFENIVLYHFANHPHDRWTPEHEADLARRFPNIRLVSDNEGWALKIVSRLKKIAVTAFPGLARRVLAWHVEALTPNYAQLRRSNDDIRYVINYVDSLAQVNGIDASKTIVETHDLRYFRRAMASHRSLISCRNLLNLRYEVSALSAANGLVAITENEAYFFRNMLAETAVYYIPEYAPGAIVCETRRNNFDYDLLFAASGNQVNVDGITKLFEQAGPDLRDMRFAICGLICQRPEVQKLAAEYPNIHLLNFLSDEELEAAYARSKACVSPTSGTGLNIKLVDALRHCKPVFATQSSMKGLGAGYEDCVLPLRVADMKALLSNPEQLHAASTVAGECYQRFALGGDLTKLFQSLQTP
ncbi:MAG: glycosyltransferase [Pseudomonadota bacterium]